MTFPKRPKKQNASGKGGVRITKLAGNVKLQGNILRCDTKHISKLRKELAKEGLALLNASGEAQVRTLPKVLRYLGNRGINTKEAEGCGYYRIATRIQELEARNYVIASKRETIIGADGLVHPRIARYVLLSENTEPNPQGELDLGDAE
ncbi:hypothetical protein H8K33_12085 [Undibacterium amnicola]|uniref:Winged helix-turn-helix domain-containing protein n=1 Tax=Undibacterium amnicola TaxID=1834038 RepID=A0ABR6XS10_9BURK|nr:helix-turn-helix domain-containing protein [Undibacterium amnicola]MBC3832255.1 hypothetical protein [Undibacterium amnicola]